MLLYNRKTKSRTFFERCGFVNTTNKIKVFGARDRNRTGTPAIHEAADFKSAVSTCFTTRASGLGLWAGPVQNWKLNHNPAVFRNS